MSENEFLLHLGDYFFLVFHTGLILFNLFAWLYKPLLKWHFFTIVITFASWGILGIWYGLGYCPLTDWHFDILRKLGAQDLPNSYISYLLQRIFSLSLAADLVDALTLGFALAALIVSVYLNFYKKK
ncbi:DUF2784 domain-containing protein [Mongoliibacter ruber]|uniref:Uncharacterized protein DUF2784 n=1 Tax=Mongoliibacter ruber TaxID=1750599 RepID=A0A2T0WGV0_9BACT|nr:DUF2784 domain-containing protein [Mongoliibacter ruber]PRY85931.1 uncharacterized protein DUF2784 [Mongoliibacter ruber]